MGEIKNEIDNEIEVVCPNKSNIEESQCKTTKFEKAMYDIEKTSKVYSEIFDDESSGKLILTNEKIKDLALNSQNNINKIKSINEYVMYYMNKDDLTGKIVETLENNTNINYTVVYPNMPKKVEPKVKELIKAFNKSIDVDLFIPSAVATTFYEGNFISYLRNIGNNYKIVKYPLGMVEITPFLNNNEPVIVMNVTELKKKLGRNLQKYKNKNKNILFESIKEELEQNYPSEIVDSYVKKDRYAKLDPERVSVIRVNNYNKLYGVTPIFKSLSAQVMLDTIDITDSKNTLAKGKKFIVQLLRKELMGQNGQTDSFEEQGYAQKVMMEALKHDLVLVTAPAFVEDVKILEQKQEATNIDTINYYRNKVLNALGISFLSNESKSSFNAVEVNVKELMKTIDKITRQVSKIINKYYQVVCKDNGVNLKYCPEISIDSSKLLEEELKLKLVDVMFNKLGCSYQTAYEIMDRDCDTEFKRRKEENEYIVNEETNEQGVDKVFYPRINAFTISGKDSNLEDNKNNNFDKREENQNKDKNKQQYDKEKVKEKV